jgi:uncharacterized membrane protein
MSRRKKKYITRRKQKEKPRKKGFIYIGSIIFIVAVLIVLFVYPGIIRVVSGPSSSGSNTISSSPSKNDGLQQDIVLQVENLTREGTYLSYLSKNNVKVKYFAVLDSIGMPHVAFDSCTVKDCYKLNRGYELTDNLAKCRNCGQKFPIDSIGTGNLSGGCWPSYLDITITGNTIRINPQDLERNDYMFL